MLSPKQQHMVGLTRAEIEVLTEPEDATPTEAKRLALVTARKKLRDALNPIVYA